MATTGTLQWRRSSNARPAGEQPELIRKLVVEGSDFVSRIISSLFRPGDETWTMIMMSPERQLVNPFFTGGSQISVSYPPTR